MCDRWRVISECPRCRSSRAPARTSWRSCRRWPTSHQASPLRSKGTAEFERAVTKLVPMIEAAAPGVPNARWIAIRLLDGDASVEEALSTGKLAELVAKQQAPDARFSRRIALQGAQ